MEGSNLLISQSLIKDLLTPDVCPKFIYYRYIEKKRTPPSPVMFKGLYFEWHLLGAVRDGQEPIYDLKADGKNKAVVDELNARVMLAKQIMLRLGINYSTGEKQLRIATDIMEGHLDLVANDFQKPRELGAKAIYDVKLTDTRIDDRYNGWGDVDNDFKAKLQATQYVKLYYDKYGVWLPFYYLVFGKNWVRIIRIKLMQDTFTQHMGYVKQSILMLDEWNTNGWNAKPEFNKCMGCHFYDICDSRATLPAVETIVF